HCVIETTEFLQRAGETVQRFGVCWIDCEALLVLRNGLFVSTLEEKIDSRLEMSVCLPGAIRSHTASVSMLARISAHGIRSFCTCRTHRSLPAPPTARSTMRRRRAQAAAACAFSSATRAAPERVAFRHRSRRAGRLRAW